MASISLPSGAPVTQPYGCTGVSLEPAQGDCAHFHQGIDYGFPYGTPVNAPAPGKIVSVQHSAGGYGNSIIEDIGQGYTVLFGHLSNITVTPGQTVAQGQNIGNVGSTGASTGPHLHFEVRQNGVNVDPASIAASAGTKIQQITGALSPLNPLTGPLNPLSSLPGMPGSDGLPGPLSALSAVGDALGKLGDPQTWVRVVLVVGGIGLVVVGGAWLVSQTGGD